jgi:hypothetical protein
MKTYWGHGGNTPYILKLRIRWRCDQLHALDALPRGKECPVPILQETRWVTDPLSRTGDEKISSGNKTLE